MWDGLVHNYDDKIIRRINEIIHVRPKPIFSAYANICKIASIFERLMVQEPSQRTMSCKYVFGNRILGKDNQALHISCLISKDF